MIYGLYLSATGVLSNSHRQDVIANNLANSETVGFKRDLAVSREQRTAPLLSGRIDAEKLPLVKACRADAWAVIGAIAGMTDRIAATRQLS